MNFILFKMPYKINKKFHKTNRFSLEKKEKIENYYEIFIYLIHFYDFSKVHFIIP